MRNTRRRFLLSAAAVSTATLAGCSDNGDENGNEHGPKNGSAPDPNGDTDRHETEIPESDEYRIRKARGQTVHLQDGETYENVIWDLTTGDDVTINTIGVEDWEIRNVGFHGYYRGGSHALMTLGAMEGDTGRVENVYLGDGGSADRSAIRPTDPSAIIVEGHNGHIDFVNCNIQGFPEAGIYAPSESEAGTCSVKNCYIGNNGVVSVRMDTDSELRDCVVFNDETTYGDEGESPDGTLVSVFPPGGVDIYETHLDAGTNEALASEAGAENNIMHSGERSGAIYGRFDVADDVGTNPVIERPSDVPKSAIEAASHDSGN